MDILLIGALSGIIAKIVKNILGYLVILFIPFFPNCPRIAAGLLFSWEQVMEGGFWPSFVGLQIDFSVAIVIGIVTVLILQHWGYDFYILKGTMVGLVVWSLFFCVLSELLSRVNSMGSVLFAQISFINHIIFGVTLTWSAVRLTNRLKENQKTQ